MKKLLTLFSLLCLLLVYAEDLLPKRNWAANPSGSKGKAVKLADGSWEINKLDDKGVMVFTFHGGAYKLESGKTYLIEWEVLVPAGQSAGTMAYLPRKPKARTPWPTGGSVQGNGKWQSVAQLLTVEPGETGAQLHLTIRGNAGKTIVKSCKITPVDGVELLPVKNWSATPSNTVGKAVKLADGSWEITKVEDRGSMVFAHHGFHRLVPGKCYFIEWELKADIGQKAGSMTYLPRKPKARSPWPTGEGKFGTGKWMTASQYLKVEDNEADARLHLVISGNAGKTIVKSCKIKEITAEEYNKSLQPKLVEQKIFEGNDLKKEWTVFNSRGMLPGKGIYYNSYENSGIFCKRLNWKAADVKMIELAVSSDQPAVIRMDFTADDNGKRRTSYLTYLTYADGKTHNLRFEVGANPSWVGTIKEITISCRGEGGKVGFERLHAQKEDNLIPFAGDGLKKYSLANIRPRGHYLLKNAVGGEIRLFDRGEKVISTVKAISKSVEFTAPELTVRAELVNAPANASLTLLRLRPLELPEIYWKGQWIWCQNGFGPNNTNVWFEKSIDLNSAPEAAQAVMTADDFLEFFINGKKVGDGSQHWASPVRFDIAGFLKPGRNSIVVRAHNVGAWGGFIADLYIRENGVDRFYSTGKEWMYHIGGDTMPQSFPNKAFLLGPPPAPPWGTRTGYLYVGPKAKLQLVKAGTKEFTVKVLDQIPADAEKLTFLLTDEKQQRRTVEAIITPSTGKWKKGETVKVSFFLPANENSQADVRLASDFLSVEGDQVIARTVPKNSRIPEPVTAKIVNAGTRPFIEINGEKYNPIYYDGYKTPKKDWMLRDAVAGGCRIVRTGVNFDDIWKAPDKLDFTKLDELMDSFDLNCPQVKVILHVRLAMPKWWCDANPDDVIRYDRDQPIRPYEDRQALASKKWIEDGSVVLRKLIRHILNSSYADKIFAVGLAEGWNSEWFWTYSDQYGQSAMSGYSYSDYATFRSYLKERYKTDAAFAAAWNKPGLTFENFVIPSRKELNKSSIITLLDSKKDRPIIDWFYFRNRALGEAIESFAKVVKEETQNRWLTGVYYGYFQMFCGIYHRLQSVGHLDVERIARSPYVDVFWAPSNYNLRRQGLSDGIMQAAENLSVHGKLVVVEQDMRTFCENDHYEAGRMHTPEMTVGAMDRAFGLLLSRGVATHWLAMHESWFREKVLLELMKHQQDVYAALPPVKNTTPSEICIVSDTESAFYTQHNLGDNPHRATVYRLVADFNFVGAPFKHLFVKDLNEDGLIGAHKLYIMTNILSLDETARKKLMERFEREKATVLWLYAAGISNAEVGPSAEMMSKFLGINVAFDNTRRIPEMTLIPELGGGTVRNPIMSGPWFLPRSGFDKVLAKDPKGDPMLVQWKNGNATHIFSVIMQPSNELLRKIAANAGVHLYSPDGYDPVLAGNDVVFLYAKSAGKKEIILPPGCRARAIAGPLKGAFTGKITFDAAIGRAYGFHVEMVAR